MNEIKDHPGYFPAKERPTVEGRIELFLRYTTEGESFDDWQFQELCSDLITSKREKHKAIKRAIRKLEEKGKIAISKGPKNEVLYSPPWSLINAWAREGFPADKEDGATKAYLDAFFQDASEENQSQCIIALFLLKEHIERCSNPLNKIVMQMKYEGFTKIVEAYSLEDKAVPMQILTLIHKSYSGVDLK